MEGDVLFRNVSYLGRMKNTMVAPEYLTVCDDPTHAGEGSFGYRIDDEGNLAKKVDLIKDGRVGSPLLDRRYAEHLGLAGNGHGRRVSYRNIAIPRMCHTFVAPGEGTFDQIVADVDQGLLVQNLVPRHMNIFGGDYSFYIPEAREIKDGRLGNFVEPGILYGNALESLAQIDAIGADLKNVCSTRGCRKLDHGPLYVSFGIPTIRFREMDVIPWR